MEHPDIARELRRLIRAQHGLITRSQATSAGLTPSAVRRRVNTGEWRLVQRGVYAVTVIVNQDPLQAMLAACFAAGPGSAASHTSAAWLWGMIEHADPTLHVTVDQSGGRHPRGVVVHRSNGFGEREVTMHRRIPCTKPLRTLVDLSVVAGPRDLDLAIDRALSNRLVTVPDLSVEIDRQSRQGRRGPGALRMALARRGLIGAPHPSVLESKALRLLKSTGLVPIGTEVTAGPSGEYRIDLTLSDKIGVELLGYAYHCSPEHQRSDTRRHNEIQLTGKTLFLYTWRDIVYSPKRVANELRQALEAGRQVAGPGDR